jgi:hypothetical protein
MVIRLDELHENQDCKISLELSTDDLKLNDYEIVNFIIDKCSISGDIEEVRIENKRFRKRYDGIRLEFDVEVYFIYIDSIDDIKEYWY